MSWLTASFALIAGVLALGWLAYERSRPSARTVALVATLSALAALGRDAFAAFPEVKPITAMTFVVGYSLGPLPGFVVGAVGMLASNFVLGQGSWTPWQMAAWGVVGLLGALTGRLTRRRLPRLPLALGCAFAALVAMGIMNLYEWSIGASHTPAALLAEVAQGITFEAVDVGSTLLFGLAFAPELARLLARSRARMEVDWQAAGTGIAAALVALLAGSAALGARPARAEASTRAVAASRAVASPRAALTRGVAYLLSAQKSDGGFGQQAGAPTTEMFTAWSAIGLAAAGSAPLHARKDGHTILTALAAGAGSLSDVGAIERTILALHACGLPAGVLDGRDLASELARHRKRDGSIEDEVNHTAFAILAMRALGDRPASPGIQAAGRWLAAQQNADGGFSFGPRGDPSDVDDTAAALQALAATGDPSPAANARAVAYLRRAENRDGGFPQEPGQESNASSTAWAVQGLLAAGQPLTQGARSPIAYLEGLQAPDGSFRYAAGVTQTPVWETAEVLPALARRPFPIASPAPARTVAGSIGVEHASSLAAALSGDVRRIAGRCLEGLMGLRAG
jgi:Squalene-hopene cyclase C-terminal domain/Prenyltransferase and squalene oxidase repeat